jgi:hypothetical protein
MRLIPLPELVVVLVIALCVLGVRTLREIRRRPLARRGEPALQARREEHHLETQSQRARLIASCVIFTIISVPLILRVVPPNGLYGFRNARTQSNPAIWYQANAFMGWALLVSAAISASVLLILPATAKRWLLWAALLAPVFAAVVASFVYLNSLT